jgi:hypothetical protein
MTPNSRNPSIHAIKYHRVVLEAIDPAKASPDSFSIKLSMRTRTSRPRVEHVLRQLPYTIKSGLSVDQANRLKSLLESLGGIARLESYVVEPGEHPSIRDERHGLFDLITVTSGPTGDASKKVCTTCGWSEPTDAEFCSLCLEPFPKRDDKRAEAEQRIVEGNQPAEVEQRIVDGQHSSEVKQRVFDGDPPAERERHIVDDKHPARGDMDPSPSTPGGGTTDWRAMLERHKTAILIGAILLLVVLLILK